MQINDDLCYRTSGLYGGRIVILWCGLIMHSVWCWNIYASTNSIHRRQLWVELIGLQNFL